MSKTLLNQSLQVLNYEGSEITFRNSNGIVMINATEMARPFCKLPAHFLENKETKSYIEALKFFTNSNKSHYRNSDSDQSTKDTNANLKDSEIISIINGGKNPGTWMHELLAMRFAQWLSPSFAVWVDVQIRAILHGNIESKFKMEKPRPKELKDKGTKWKTSTITFTVEEYSCATDCTPSNWLTPDHMLAVKNAVDKMCYVLNR